MLFFRLFYIRINMGTNTYTQKIYPVECFNKNLKKYTQLNVLTKTLNLVNNFLMLLQQMLMQKT